MYQTLIMSFLFGFSLYACSFTPKILRPKSLHHENSSKHTQAPITPTVTRIRLLPCPEETQINYLAKLLIKACTPNETSTRYPHGSIVLATFRGRVVARKKYDEGLLVHCETSNSTIALNNSQKDMLNNFLTNCPRN